jgi:hypothetical protein
MADQSKSKQKSAVAVDERPNPGDEAPEGTLGTGEDTCRQCGEAASSKESRARTAAELA